MIENILNCQKCKLCKNQKPLLDVRSECQLFWVGLSAKKICNEDDMPLSPTTNSGKIIAQINDQCNGIIAYRTNIVKCLPLDEKGKLRYPDKSEIALCVENLILEISELKPKVVFLLGKLVADSVAKKLSIQFQGYDNYDILPVEHNGVLYVSIQHPSYMHVYRRKELPLYVSSIVSFIEQICLVA